MIQRICDGCGAIIGRTKELPFSDVHSLTIKICAPIRKVVTIDLCDICFEMGMIAIDPMDPSEIVVRTGELVEGKKP